MTRKHKPKQWKGYAWFASEHAMDDMENALFFNTKKAAANMSQPCEVIVPVTITLSAPKRPATRKK